MRRIDLHPTLSVDARVARLCATCLVYFIYAYEHIYVYCGATSQPDRERWRERERVWAAAWLSHVIQKHRRRGRRHCGALLRVIGCWLGIACWWFRWWHRNGTGSGWAGGRARVTLHTPNVRANRPNREIGFSGARTAPETSDKLSYAVVPSSSSSLAVVVALFIWRGVAT